MKDIVERIVLDPIGKAKYSQNKVSAESTMPENSSDKSCSNDEKSRPCAHVTDKTGGNISMINAHSRNQRLNIMVIGAALGLVFCLLMLTSYKGDLPGEVVGIISTVSGIFGACLKDAYSFEFGSSRGSKDKDDRISATLLERLNMQ